MDKKTLKEKLVKKTRERVKEAFTGKDVHIIKAVSVIDELDKMANLISENAREWFGFHFPELNSLVEDNETFLKLVLIGDRKNFSEKKIMEVYNNEEKAKEIEIKAKNSMGSPIEENPLKEIQKLAVKGIEIKKQRNELAEFIEKEIKEILPDFSDLAEPLIAARILAKAGSARKLALMPSSTIQLLGAEKALFQHIRSGAKPPKYGYIFAHPMLKKVKRSEQGKFARTLAGKLSIAAKTDYFKGKSNSKELKKELEKRINELNKTK
ncbi:NOP58 family protein [Candidatus Micrarchaeota archaeon]|nr:NOP58 family protein [Candidatus Micrarchaeota archaeon]MBU2477050.1 NOP58 family protein [Candidatus Micrarchaeota archaeon]